MDKAEKIQIIKKVIIEKGDDRLHNLNIIDDKDIKYTMLYNKNISMLPQYIEITLSFNTPRINFRFLNHLRKINMNKNNPMYQKFTKSGIYYNNYCSKDMPSKENKSININNYKIADNLFTRIFDPNIFSMISIVFDDDMLEEKIDLIMKIFLTKFKINTLIDTMTIIV